MTLRVETLKIFDEQKVDAAQNRKRCAVFVYMGQPDRAEPKHDQPLHYKNALRMKDLPISFCFYYHVEPGLSFDLTIWTWTIPSKSWVPCHGRYYMTRRSKSLSETFPIPA